MSQQATAYEPLVPVAMIVAMAKNRVIGGSPDNRNNRQICSQAAPIRRAAASETDFSTGGKSASARMSLIHSQQLTGSP